MHTYIHMYIYTRTWRYHKIILSYEVKGKRQKFEIREAISLWSRPLCWGKEKSGTLQNVALDSGNVLLRDWTFGNASRAAWRYNTFITAVLDIAYNW
jgi:hypothetical protein